MGRSPVHSKESYRKREEERGVLLGREGGARRRSHLRREEVHIWDQVLSTYQDLVEFCSLRLGNTNGSEKWRKVKDKDQAMRILGIGSHVNETVGAKPVW